MHIGLYLKKKREEKGYTQVKLAELAGVDESTVKRLEKKSNPKETKGVKRIYEILGIPASDDKDRKNVTFNKQMEYLNPSGVLGKLGIKNAQKLSMELDDKLVNAYNLGKQGKYQEALDIYLAFSIIFPCEFIYLGCASMYSMSGNYKMAIDYSDKVLCMNANNYEALLTKGISLGYIKKYDEAFEMLKSAIKVNETYDAHYNLAVCHQMNGDTKDAIIHYVKCLEINLDFASAHLNIGVCYFEQHNLEKSLYHIDEAIKLEPSMYQAYGRKGEHYRFIEQHDSAIKYFEKCLNLDPNNHQALFGISVSLAEKGKISEAIIYLKKFFDLYIYEYIDTAKNNSKDVLIIDIGYEKTRLISFEYQEEDFIKVGINGVYMKVNIKKDDALIFIGAGEISDETGSIFYPMLGKIYKDKFEFDQVINRIKKSVELFKYFDKPLYCNFDKDIKVNIIERKKDVFIEMFFADKYKIIGITDTKSEGFNSFIQLYKKYKQFRIHIECNGEVFIIDGIDNPSIDLLNK